MHENKINHKKYIGMTGRDPEIRWRKGTDYKNCIAFNRAIQKYGWDNFDHIILFTGQTREEACKKEVECIKQYKTQDPNFGYNICGGGGGVVGLHHTEETKKRIAEKLKGPLGSNYGGKTQTPESLKKMSESLRGRKLSEEHKRKIGEGLKGHKSSDKVRKACSERSKHSVIREDGKVYSSVKEAAAELGVTYTAISNAIRRNNKCGGYYWKYAKPCA